MISDSVGRIDVLVSAQLNEILHAAPFLELEGLMAGNTLPGSKLRTSAALTDPRPELHESRTGQGLREIAIL